MNIKYRVLTRLKPKVKRFGFTKKVLKSVAAEIADKLDLADDASDEDTDAEIDKAIDAALPYIAMIQSQANSQLDEWKKANDKDDEDEDEDESDEASASSIATQTRRSSKSTKTTEKTDGQSKELKALMDAVVALTKEVSTLKEGKTADTRRSRLETLLKDAGTFGKRTLKSFAKMSFKDDEEFDEFISEVEEDLKALNQERADAGLSTMGNPPGGKGDKQEKKEEVFSDAEIDALAN